MQNSYDLIIIGGGATGSGIALDAASRGYKTLLLEQSDFASGTSSKSTKLIHGGVRYLEKAFKQVDKRQYELVSTAIYERYYFFKNARYLCKNLKIITPIKHWLQIPYYYAGLKIYDFIAKKRTLGDTEFLTSKKVFKKFPFVKKDIVGAISFHDGSFNDSKMVISLLQTAKSFGACVKNYTKAEEFFYKDGKIDAIKVYDKIENRSYMVKSKCVINASGLFVDKLRKRDDQNAKDLVSFSSGTHIIIPKKYLPSKQGILIPKTKDGRVLFILPWQEHCLVGTTDTKTIFTPNPKASVEDISYLKAHLKEYFEIDLKDEEVLSSWCGLRTLLKEDALSKDTVREHIIDISQTNLVSIASGKWTTYRKMSQECLDFCIEEELLEKRSSCRSHKIKLTGNENLRKTKETLNNYKLDEDIKKSLYKSYGTNCLEVLKLAKKHELFERLHPKFPYIKAEIIYCIENEFVKYPIDFLSRRVRVAFLNKNSCLECVDIVCNIMKDYLSWDEKRYEDEKEVAKKEINELF